MLKRPLTASAVVGVIILALVAALAPIIAPHDPYERDVRNKLTGPSRANPLGTDQLGRDTLSRLLYGARIALKVTFPTIGLSLVLGVFTGTLAGFFPRLEILILPPLDILKAFPPVVFAIAIIGLFGGSVTKLILVMAVTWFPTYARVVRSQIEAIREKEYVEAARAIGAQQARVILRHVIPNCISPLIILAAMDIPVIISYESALSFLGLGVPPPEPSWGTILSNGYNYLRYSPWMVIFGGAALAWATLSFTLLGEGLRDHLDPKMRGVIR